MDINLTSQIFVYTDLASFPATGAAKTFYVADDTEKLYRWTGSAYVEVSAGSASGVTSFNTRTGAVVSASGDYTTAQLTESTDKKFVTDAQLVVIGNTSGTNSGNETTSTIGSLINGSTAATPNDTDLVATAESSVLKKITWTNVKAFLKTYFDTIYQAAGTYLTSANITQTITNGVTTNAPSEDAVFDALALKANATRKQVTFIVLSGSPADGLTYFHGRPVVFTQNTAHNSANNIYVPTGCTSIKYVSVSYMTQNAGSNEAVAAYIRVSNTTDYTISTNIDLSNNVQFREYTTPITGLTGATDYLQIKTVCPTWVATNPTSITMIINVEFE